MDRPTAPQVTCPNCHERQTLAAPDGYTCVGCGTAWHLVTCRSCGDRFHMRPETQAWNCPSCGTRNEEDAGYAAPAATPMGLDDPAGSGTTATRRSPGPALGGRGPMLAILAGVLIVIVLVWALFLRNPGGSTASTTPTAPPTSNTTDTLAHLCGDVTPDMPLRVDSVRRTEQEVRADGKALRQEGNAEAAAAAKQLADALEELAVALDTQGDTLAANQQLQQALAALPCGG